MMRRQDRLATARNQRTAGVRNAGAQARADKRTYRAQPYHGLGVTGAPLPERVTAEAATMLLRSKSPERAAKRAERMALKHRDAEGKAFFLAVAACLRGA